MYIPSFLRQSTHSIRELRKQWRAYLSIADNSALDLFFLRTLTHFLETFSQIASSASQKAAPLNLEDIVESGNLSIFIELLKFVNRISAETSPAHFVTTSSRASIGSDSSIEDANFSVHLQGTRNKTLIVMDMLLQYESCLKAILPIPNVIRTLKQVLPLVAIPDQIWVLKSLSRLICTDVNLYELISNDGMKEIFELLKLRDSDNTAEVLHMIHIACQRHDEIVAKKNALLEQPEHGKLESSIEKTPSSGSLLITRVVSAVGEYIKPSSSLKSRPSLASKMSKTPSDELLHNKQLVLSAPFIQSETARVRKIIDDRMSALDALRRNSESDSGGVYSIFMKDEPGGGSSKCDGVYVHEDMEAPSTPKELNPEPDIKSALLNQVQNLVPYASE